MAKRTVGKSEWRHKKREQAERADKKRKKQRAQAAEARLAYAGVIRRH